MSKYIDGEELKRIVREEVKKDGKEFLFYLGEWFCGLVDEMPAADVVELKSKEGEE